MKREKLKKNPTEYDEVRDVFNYVYLFFDGKISLEAIIAHCSTYGLFFDFLENMQLLIGFNYKECMTDIFELFKQYSFERVMTYPEWQELVAKAHLICKKNSNNKWCIGVMNGVLSCRERMDKRLTDQETAGKAA